MPNPEHPPESPKADPAKESLQPEPTEQVVGEISDFIEEHKSGLHSDEERKEAFTQLHKALDKFENHEMKRLYDEGRMPTFDSLHQAAAHAVEALAKVNDPDASRIARLLSGSIQSIKTWSRRYISALLRFRNSNLARLRMNTEEQRDAFTKADGDRRRIHDALLGSLASLNDLLKEADEYAEFSTPAEWHPGDELPKNTARTADLIFSPKALADRDLIR
ncbi:MAG TPA: hypothetical protein VHC46_03130, partial [Thermodesulfobacteriota bacterium]|nr:hypothetical protein [Thermodesulfobacteriota bacterium]